MRSVGLNHCNKDLCSLYFPVNIGVVFEIVFEFLQSGVSGKGNAKFTGKMKSQCQLAESHWLEQ